MSHPVLVIEPGTMPKVVGRGRKRGSGSNYRLLKRLAPNGNPVFDVPYDKMQSIRATAHRGGIRVKVRQMVGPDDKPTGLYCLQRLS